MAFQQTWFEQPFKLRSTDFVTGTWTQTVSSGLSYFTKTATDETSTVNIAIPLLQTAGLTSTSNDGFRVQLDSIYVPMRITTADLDAVIAGTLTRYEPYKALTAATNVGSTSITITESNTQVTAAATDRVYIATVASPAPAGTISTTTGHIQYFLSLSINAAATTVVRIYDTPWARYQLLD